MQTSAPTLIKLHRRARSLELAWADGRRVDLPCEYLRVFSPSAELRGHGLPEPMLLGGKREVNIVRIEPVGSYAVRLVFDDGHDSRSEESRVGKEGVSSGVSGGAPNHSK